MSLKRDYAAFALLADVRNHSGRHDKIWQPPTTVQGPSGRTIDIPGWWYDAHDGGHDRLEPISTPRGVPDDASPEWREFVRLWTERSEIVETSWVTVEEIANADWDQVVYCHGIMSEEEYLALRDHGKIPKMSAMSAGGEGDRTVNEIEYAAGERGESSTTVRSRWKEGTLRSVSGYFLEIAETMERVCPPTSKVRFMLLFES